MDSAENVLTITERPYGLWFTGAMFSGFGLIMLLQGESPLAMGAIFFLIGAFLLLNSPIVTASLDRTRNLLVLHSRSLIRRRTREILLTDLAHIEVQRSRGSRGGQNYRLAFVLYDGTVIPMTSYYSSGSGGKARQAEQMRQYLGLAPGPLPGVQPAERLIQPPAQPAFMPSDRGETSGVSWHMETGVFNNLPITRWASPASGFADGFLLLAQKPAQGTKLSGGLLGGLTGLAYRHLLHLYGFRLDRLPDIESAELLDAFVPGLDPHYVAYTARPEAARRLVSAWVVIPLVRWAEQNPMQAVNTTTQLVVLFHPGGTELAALNLTVEKWPELVDLGVDLVKESAAR
jgi:hypothetical protein